MLPVRDHLPSRRTPVVTYALIALNILTFVWMRALITAGYPPQRLLTEYGLVPLRLLQTPLDASWTVLTSMFMHDPSGWLHLGGNMLFLWIFGDNVEDALGRGRYLAFYLLAGLGAAAAQFFIDPASHIPMVGASGAISGVLAAYGSLYPRAPVTVFFGLFFELPAWIVILEYFAANLFNALGAIGLRGGGVAFFAHLGGFVAGLFLIRGFMIGRSRRKSPDWPKKRSSSRRPPPNGWGRMPPSGSRPPARRWPFP
ncbi:rhomboid family intramembrane serine protease [Chondromyces crocatus]|uniref:Peptidase S54 n=1 Tax=Chondromyces crocatus TaxID=52 RepID=A0A0K1EBY0_CHOCO|nr:rhomboid family intramembrane serine protease [Chondromyces crocatus]AKT38063.1 peptidase S54 [Chondromyces crocatus]